jgi:ATP-binding protein involved in chromosome partitioning
MTDGSASLLSAARAALARVDLPGGGGLSGSDRLASLTETDQGRITAVIRIDPSEAGDFAPVRTAAEAALRAVPGVGQALVVLTAEGAGGAGATTAPPRLRTDAAPTAAQRATPLSGVRHVVAVASGKGGVGKSTTAVNLALGLRLQGLTVGILDADVHGPSLPTLLNLTQKPRLGPDRRILPVPAQGLMAMSMGLMVDDETAMIWRGPMVTSAITQMLAEVDWGTLDVLIVDMPPGTGDAQLALAQGARLAGAVIVSTPQDLALIDARRGVAMFRKVDVPILGVVENMAYFLCPDCGGRHAPFGQGGAEAEARRLGVPFLGAVPLDMDLRLASDRGQPVTARDPDGPIGRIYQDLARGLMAQLGRAGADLTRRTEA